VQVVTLSGAGLTTAVGSLADNIRPEFIPTHFVSIASGGVEIGKSLRARIRPSAVSIKVRAERPSTGLKKRVPFLAYALRFLPYLITDRARLIESRVLQWRNELRRERVANPLSQATVRVLSRIPARPETRVLVVDDAVDGGGTLAGILKGLDHVGEAGGLVRSAVIVITRENPIVWPDYYLMKDTIVRFPWSYDFKN